ncbi:cardiolipin synthase [Motilibacter peucedani]|uniref:Cardiolipin synthase n=1 Tax=Motilibacter peucedani TaxID=598650 RepID=A0A420XST7_9ACTN|nr:CDP-alcohol phosphatidyltransferase family protein [Motilibacter peucedani]RKS77881.1 cardiolipin synthase [Motilibacter peucedani]
MDGPPPPELVPTDRVLTVPNALSALRLVGVPFFLWLVLDHHDGWALALLVVSGLTDWLDGKIARATGTTSRLGALLDPAADRLYIVATLVGLTIRGVLPLWVPVVLVARELVLGVALLVLRRHGYGPLPVHFLGKAATANLLYAFPLLLLGDGRGTLESTADAFGWAFAVWGTVLYWYAGVLYLAQARELLRRVPRLRVGKALS